MGSDFAREKMKHSLRIVYLLTFIIFSACSRQYASCDSGICISLDVLDKSIELDVPLTLNINVESDKDIKDLKVTLDYGYADFLLDKTNLPKGWQLDRHEGNEIIWVGETSAHSPISITVQILVPPTDEDGVLTIFAYAFDEMSGQDPVIETMGIYFTDGKGEIYRANTPLPITRTPLLPTMDPQATLTTTAWPTSATKTIFPMLTPLPTETNPPSQRTPTISLLYPAGDANADTPVPTPLTYP